jgi:predicted nucleotidyltransferase component of viral defense system
MNRPTHATPGGHAYLELQRRARAERVGTQELLVWYMHERFLYRLSRSSYRDRLILKGGMLLVAFEARRATQDIDLLGSRVSNDEAAVSGMVADIARIDVPDGVEFAVDQIAAATIREDANYSGVRVTMPARVDRAKILLRVDLSVGDPVTPTPIEVNYPSLLDSSFTLRGYPIATILAEKIVTLIERGDTNTRERDVADILVLAQRHRPSDDELIAAITATAAHRTAELRPVAEAVRALGEMRQRSWEVFVKRAGLVGRVPEQYQAALDEVATLVDPLLAP